jgi:(p)ppGpp synthase/HD superfamily hydrolase
LDRSTISTRAGEIRVREVAERAEAIAREAHRGQRYGDRDYIDAHVAQVATIVARLGYDSLYVATAWLHDVVEDTPITERDLLDQGIPKDVVAAVEALTKRENEEHEQYLDRIAAHPFAIAVKYADSSANFASTTLLSPHLSDADFRNWSREYASNIAYLLPLLPDTD